MARTLVVYFSRTGTTKLAAEAIARTLGADLEEIVDRTPRLGVVGYLRCGYEATARKLTRIEKPARDPGNYELVVVGSPVWGASLSSPVRTYLEEHRGRLSKVAFFCTCGGRGGERVLGQMEDTCRKDPVARLVLREAEVVRKRARPKYDAFCAELRSFLPTPLERMRAMGAL
jgi:flavodoxin